jgi:hypothetical protein
LGYRVEQNDPTLTWDFCCWVAEIWEEHERKMRNGEMPPSKFCSRVIDRCVLDGIMWPPSFSTHRDCLRAAEKENRLTFDHTPGPDGCPRRLGVDPESL